jgi:IS605 OrfB family transposase
LVQILTIRARLAAGSATNTALARTLEAFAAGCNSINQAAPTKMKSKVQLQKLCYHMLRQEHGLSANLAIRAIARVAGARKTAGKKGRPVGKFRPTSVQYDARIFSIKGEVVSLGTLEGRRHVSFILGAQDRARLAASPPPTSATLVLSQKGLLWLHIQIKVACPESVAALSVIGIDLGRTDIAVTSTGQHFSGQSITKARDHFSSVRSSLQCKASQGTATRSTRRRVRQLLQQLGGSEKRFSNWHNHTVSRQIVNQALASHSAIALEDLTGIRERTNQQPRSKVERRRSNRWAFYQLRQFITYKAVLAGVPLYLVPPAYTSQTCHRCLRLGDRKGKFFSCLNPECGWNGDSDYNGACVIAVVGAVVSQPGGPGLTCVVQAGSRATENPCL